MTNTTPNTPNGESLQKTQRPIAKWVFLGILALAIFVFFAFFAKQFSEASLEINFEDKKIAINTKNLMVTPEETAKLDQDKYYIDSSMGFSFRKPDSKEWLQPQVIKGIEEFFKAKGADVNQEIIVALQRHPWSLMLTKPTVVRFTTGETLNVEITEESSNEVFEEYIKNITESEEFRELDLNDEDTKKLIRDMRIRFFGFSKMSFTNEFTITVYDKQKLVGVPVKHSLASVAVNVLGPVAMILDQLVADERTVMGGSSVSLTNVKVNGEITDVRFDRLFLFAENKDRYYMVEVGFSPQTKSSLKVWTEMERMLQSFSVLS